jgi:acyl-CoA thioesterase II
VSDLPEMLQLEDAGDSRYRVFQPSESAEGRDVVFSGQLLAQTIMASDRSCGSAKDIKSVHSIFARAGTYTMPIELVMDSMQAGRTWASDTVTAIQNDKLLCRSLVLMSIDDPDLMRHQPPMPDVPRPDDVQASGGQAYPGSEVRRLPDSEVGGVPVESSWIRFSSALDSVAANQAILSWATTGQIIGLGMRPHPDAVDISQAHRSISTGVIGHTINFHERFDISDWVLVTQEATYAGRGRVHGRGSAFTQDGRLVATFSQDSMARKVEGELDPKRAM